MPAILERLVSQLKAKGHDEHSAYAIATAALQRSGNLKKGTRQATDKGVRRGHMSPAQRSNDRASKRSRGKHGPMDFLYNAKTNRSKLRSK